eukprot:scaffold521_cov167-Amphora_coffeaeformis.AAC.44
MADLLACADDDLADAALSVLMSLAVPPDLYKQQSPDSSTVNGSTALHTSKTQCHARLTACAVGWGTRAQGLGLEAVVSADDASDPPEAGFLDFGYYETGAEEMSRIFMEHMEMFRDKDEMSVEEGTSDESSASKKRRRVMETKSTAELFFTALQKAGGRSKIPQDRLFSLLADVRLARSFHSRALRVRAVERRLKALITITHSHPSQEVMTGYFQAQPELCVEIVDLLRPTISSAHVSANAANPGIMRQHDAIAGLAQGTSIPLQIQDLAVELLTALVCRRDGSTTALSGTARLSGVFVELGLGKGQYMGVLPTLVRYSLAALTAEPPAESATPIAEDEDPAVEIGLEFVRATMAPLPPRPELVLKALEFIERVLTLTSTIVSNATGASALTEGGLIPSVLSLIAIPSDSIVQRLLGSHDCSPLQRDQIRAKVRFATAQVLQILEASVVTHSNSLTAFYDLQGVESLVARLASEMEVSEEENNDSMETDDGGTLVSLRFSQRVLLYGLYTCLTVVFHQEPSSALTAASSQTGSVQLRKPAVTKAVKKVMNNIVSYGGHIAYLVSTLLADVMNNDPQIVRHVHTSGIGKAVLSMLNKVEPGTANPVIPPVGDLITALPNVLSALALTEDGAQAVFDANPFPSLLKVYHYPKYAMPRNRCLLNDNTSFIGTGLEEVMRHVDKLKPLIIDAVVASLKEIIKSAEELIDRERENGTNLPSEDLVDSRSALIQYILNAGQILEHILHNEDNITPFVDAGGLDAVLDLFRSSLPRGRHFLAHISALSSPSVSTLHHSTVEDVLFMALRCIVVKYDAIKLTKKLAAVATEYLNSFEDSRHKLLGGDPGTSVLQYFPTRPLHELGEEGQHLDDLSTFLWEAASVQWITSCLGMAIKTIVRRGEEPASPARRVEREWKKEISSESLRALFLRLAKVNQMAILDVCEIRDTVDFEEREKVRLSSGVQGVKFRLRIVCPEGAIVRDGIEIDSCASVGSMSMGEVADAFDRCVNSSGILRYRTRRGWVSEMTRGHGREPITEVLDITKDGVPMDESSKAVKKRLEYGIPDLQTVGCGVLARLQTSHHDLVSALSKVSVQCVRILDTSSLSFEEGTTGAIVKMTVNNLAEISQSGFDLLQSKMQASGSGNHRPRIDDAGAAMYLGFLLDSLYSCLFDEKRERRIINLPLLMNLTSSGKLAGSSMESEETRAELSGKIASFGYLDAIEYLFEHCLNDFEVRSGQDLSLISSAPPVQRVGRSVASTFSPLVRFIRRLVCTPISLSPLASILSRLKWDQIPSVSGDEGIRSILLRSVQESEFFEPEHFARGLHIGISDIIQTFWEDKRLRHAPPYLVHPVAGLVGEVIVALEDSCKKKPKTSRPTQGRGQLLSEWIRGTARQQQETEAGFDPSDEAIQRLQEMGFSEDHALDALESTRSNRIDVAMEYALSHPPPSPSTAERRRNQRAERQRRREEDRQRSGGQNEAEGSSNTTEQENRQNETPTSEEPTNKEEPVEPVEQDDHTSESHEKLTKWIDTAAPICCGILTGAKGRNPVSKATDGDAETEAMAVVLCSFLFDICHRYPDKKSAVVKSLLTELKKALQSSSDDSLNEHAIAALCHAVVLFTRALPKTRLMILENCLVGDVVSLLSDRVVAKLSENSFVWPEFMSSSLLFLEVMAQPVVAFTGKDPLKDFSEIYKDEASLPAELSTVYRQHMQQRRAFSEVANTVFELPESNNKELSGSPESMEEPKTNPFDLVPSFFPLLPKDSIAPCVEMCKKLLSTRSKSGSPPPGIIHAVLLLLLQLIRDPRISSECLRDGLADEVLDLPPSSRFTGNTGLVTLVLRRLLEDESTLQVALESEIKSVIAKIHAKDKDNPRSDSTGIPLAKFLEAVTPLICRDQMSFLRAMCMSVRLELSSSRGRGVIVLRINQQERATSSKALADLLPMNKEQAPFRLDARASPGARRRSSSGGTPKGKPSTKSTRRSSAKKARGVSQTFTSPAAAIVSLLINLALKSLVKERQGSTGEKVEFFLSSGELLDILTDLVIAVPACSPVVHNYRPFKNKEKLLKSITGDGLKHALANSIHPPKTFVSFLLHFLLGQDRWSVKYDPQLWERKKEAGPDNESLKAKKRTAFSLAKTTQAAGRVLAALASRPGDGRKRVIEDLAFALSGGRLGHGSVSPGSKVPLEKPGPSAIHALQTWGELCLGLIAPRGSGKTLEGSSSIRVENVKIMLDCGMVHALLFALHHVPLTHPMAPSVCEALLLPVEVLIRPSVSSAVKDFVKKIPSKPSEESGETKSGDDGNNQVSGGNNEMELETLVNVDNQERGPMVEEEMDVDVGNEEQSTGSGMSHEDAEEESSIEETDSEMDDEDDDDDDDDDDEDEGSSLMDDNEVELRDGELDDGNGWVDGNGDLVVYGGGDNPVGYDEGNDEVPMPGLQQGIEDGWTRIESTGFGGMFMGAPGLGANRRGPGLAAGAGAGMDERSRGFIDAAEVMIGSLIRSGEISSDAIAEIEGTLGVRISHERLRRGEPQDGLRDTAAVDSPFQGSANGGRQEAIGTVPHVHQRTQPEIGYSFVSNSNRLFEVSSLEYVFGGPSVTAGNRNYDIVTPIQDDEAEENMPTLSQFDLQLFPQGPTTPNGGRTQMALHPLLCGVDLPPVNSVVSDLLPHGIRARRPGHLATRRPGEWTNPSLSQGGYLVSTSNGNIIRSNRSNSWAPLGNGMSNRDINGPVGWTDDGLPFDSSVGDLTSALADALTASARRPPEPSIETEAESPAAQNDGRETEVDGRVTVAAVDSMPTAGQDQEAQYDDDDDDDAGDEDDPMDDGNQSPRSATDGDQVASSLAEGLRLSAEPGEAEASANGTGSNEGDNTAVPQPADEMEISQDEEHPDVEQEGQEEAVGEGQEPSGAGTDLAPPNANGLVCPPDIDPEVFESLPPDMQQDLVAEHAATEDLAAQVEGTSIDPDVLADLPEDIRNEILEQQRREREAREQNNAPADPSRAEQMDNASFLASLEPELRGEILLTADETFLNSLPSTIRAEADVLRERAMAQRRTLADLGDGAAARGGPGHGAGVEGGTSDQQSSSRRRHRNGKIKVDLDQDSIVYTPESFSPPIARADIHLVTTFLYLISPMRPQRLMQQLVYNLSTNEKLRSVMTALFIGLLHDDIPKATHALEEYSKCYKDNPDDWRTMVDSLFLDISSFPPNSLIGAAPDLPESDPFSSSVSASLLRRKQGLGTAASAAANLPKSAGGPNNESKLPLVVCTRVINVLLSLCKSSIRYCLHLLEKQGDENLTVFDRLLDLLAMPAFYKSAANLDHLLTLLESVVSPLSHLPKGKDEEVAEISEKDVEAATAAGKTYADVPRVVVNQSRLKRLCSILRMETCRDIAFTKVNTIIRRLCRIEENRGYVLEELASVAHGLGTDAVRDLRSLRIRMEQTTAKKNGAEMTAGPTTENGSPVPGSAATSVALSTSTSELKLLRVLQALHSLCTDPGEEMSGKKHDTSIIVTEELLHLLRQMQFDELWTELSACLKVVHVLEGVPHVDEEEGDGDEGDDGSGDGVDRGGRKLRNSSAGLRALVQVPKCRQFLEFDVKRSWFKAQMRRLRQHASRRHGSLRLHIKRDRVFQEAYNYLRLRNAEEMRGRLHVTFQNEEGVDAGGLSREFFAILAKEMFNPNYALFTATEDGCTFQPNQNSGINPDHLSFFRFVGRIVGKALADGYLLDAHFTRSLYKHMLGMQPTHPDMEAIDPDYYRNLKTILDYNLEDIGLDHLTFSMEDMSFGRTQIIDLVPNGRSTPVTEENKEDYVSKICQYRMTTAIKNQIKAYLDGFHELINPELISIFTPRELELMISGLPDIDVDDLKKNTEYTGWRPADKEIGWFWKIMYELSRDEKAKFLQFVTGSAKVPLAGFSELQGMRGTKKFTINKDSSGGSKGALMSAHTCFNTLDLPVYQSEEELRAKLLYAINEGTGAFLFA